MKKLSVKMKVTLWYTALMTLLVAIILAFLFSVGGRLVKVAARDRLIEMAMKGYDEIEFEDDRLEFDDDLQAFTDGIYLSVYDLTGQRLFGDVPRGFHTNTPFFEEGIYSVTDETHTWTVYDTIQRVKGYGEVWIRSVASDDGANSALNTILSLFMWSLPVFVIFAAVGGYIITRRAFKPVSQIVQAAEQIGGGKDLTQRIRLGEGKDEIYTLANTFDGMFDRLQESFEKEKQFTSDASHELRTPVSVIISQCEYALEHAATWEEAVGALDTVLEQARKMSGLISQLLTLARTDKGHQKLNLELVNLSDLMEIIAEQQREYAQEKNIRISAEITPDLIIRGDETLLMRMVINLVSNGIKYGQPGGHLDIRLKDTQEGIVGEVEDDGIGIAPENLDRIWDRFYQEDSSRTSVNQGMGLGLSMVKWIIQAHNGEVDVESIPGKGSKFSFILPKGNKDNL